MSEWKLTRTTSAPLTFAAFFAANSKKYASYIDNAKRDGLSGRVYYVGDQHIHIYEKKGPQPNDRIQTHIQICTPVADKTVIPDWLHQAFQDFVQTTKLGNWLQTGVSIDEPLIEFIYSPDGDIPPPVMYAALE